MKSDLKKLAEVFEKRRDDEKLPLFTLAEFFEGNDIEYSIAPNQWGYGRPTLAEIYEQLKKVESRTDVAWVRVALHGETDVGEYDAEIYGVHSDDEHYAMVSDGEFIYDIRGDAILICTTAGVSEIEQAADCERLESDGADGVFEAQRYTEIPRIPTGYDVLCLWWD